MYRDDTSSFGVHVNPLNNGRTHSGQLVLTDRARTLRAMDGRRNVVDYGLKRRALLAELHTGRRSLAEACDAHPYLQLAAEHYGEDAGNPCPVCDRRSLRHVHYVYGDVLGKSSGQAKSFGELERMQDQFGEFGVYVVEVCRSCGWNHLIRSFVLGRAPHRPGIPNVAGG